MFSKVFGIGLSGIDAYEVSVEVDVSDGLPAFVMVGVLAAEVKEAQDRVRTALRNGGFTLRPQKVTVNLSPAGVRKSGTAFDLAIAAGVLGAYGVIDCTAFQDVVLLGELGLDGQVRPVRGVLSMVLAMAEKGLERCFLPEENVAEGMAADCMEIVKIRNLKEVVEILNEPDRICFERASDLSGVQTAYGVDFCEVNGQKLMRRATEVAVAGGHNLLYIGPPGSGKSMMARRIPTIMPELSREEQLEVSKVYSICGMLPEGHALVGTRPYRAPHHTISAQALTGGGIWPKPGEISLASRGVLFLDELPEFSRESLEVLRQPLEDGQITVSRAAGSATYPSHFQLVAAMNPCKCGYYGHPTRPCTCSLSAVRQYRSRVSGPLLDRIDLCVEMHPVAFDELHGTASAESSADLRRQVLFARQVQAKRYAAPGFEGVHCNARLTAGQVRRVCRMTPAAERLLRASYETLGLSARAHDRILRVARTVADLAGKQLLDEDSVLEALQYRAQEKVDLTF